MFFRLLTSVSGRLRIKGMRWTQRHHAREGLQGGINSVSGLENVLTSGVEAYGKDVWI